MLLQKRARAPSCALGFETGATRFLSERPERAGQVEIRLEPHFSGHELDQSFYLSPS
jgi:hypothetical protein